MRITMVCTGYVGLSGAATILVSLPGSTLSSLPGSTLSYCLLTKISFGFVLPNFRYCLYRGRTSLSTMFFLSFESERCE
jgi:hypothetical protein